MFGCKWQKSQRKMRMKGTMHQSTPTNLGSRVWQINGLGDVGGGRGVVGGGGGGFSPFNIQLLIGWEVFPTLLSDRVE